MAVPTGQPKTFIPFHKPKTSGHLPNGKRKKKLRRKLLHKRKTVRIAIFGSPHGFAFTNLQFPRYKQ